MDFRDEVRKERDRTARELANLCGRVRALEAGFVDAARIGRGGDGPVCIPCLGEEKIVPPFGSVRNCPKCGSARPAVADIGDVGVMFDPEENVMDISCSCGHFWQEQSKDAGATQC